MNVHAPRFAFHFPPNSNVCWLILIHWKACDLSVGSVQLQNRKPNKKINRVQKKQIFFFFLERNESNEIKTEYYWKDQSKSIKDSTAHCRIPVMFTSDENEFIKNDSMVGAFFHSFFLWTHCNKLAWDRRQHHQLLNNLNHFGSEIVKWMFRVFLWSSGLCLGFVRTLRIIFYLTQPYDFSSEMKSWISIAVTEETNQVE